MRERAFSWQGLCRVFHAGRLSGQRPLKSQNMALNSYITKDGLEIGRAQAMQAEAAGIEPTVEMNPILLKPTSNVGSQVIVNGEVLGNMKAMDYYANKRQLIPEIEKAFEKLSDEYDIIVIEGSRQPRGNQSEGKRHRQYGNGPDCRRRPCCSAAILTGAACSPPCTAP